MKLQRALKGDNMDFNQLDYIIIIIILISALSGYRKGLFISVFSLVSLIVSLYLAFAYGKTVADYMESHFNLVEIISKYLEKNIPILVWNPSNFIGNTIDIFGDYCEGAFVKICHLFSTADFYLKPAQYLAKVLLTMGVFLLIFVLCYSILNIMIFIINKLIFRESAVNQMGGMVVSLGKTGLLLAIFLIVIVPLLKAGAYVGNQQAAWAMSYINNSILLNRLQEIINFIQIMAI